MSDQKNKKRFPQGKRLAIALVIVGLLLIGCIAASLVIVIRDGNEYRHKALAQATGSSTTILARPGDIVDANGVYLATSKKVYRLILDPKVMNATESSYAGSLDKTVELVAEAFALDETELRRSFTEDVTRSYIRFEKDRVLSEAEVEHYKELVEAFNKEKSKHNKDVDEKKGDRSEKITARIAGVWFEEEYRREYPLSELLSKVVGYTTKDAGEGLIGLERRYDSVLRGTNGKEYTYVDEQGNVTKELTDALDGQTLVTSLDSNVARMVKEEIDAFQQGEIGGHRVTVLVMDPSNGEIIAMESDTDFDLNDPTNLSNLFTEEELQHPEETFLLQEAFAGRLDKLEEMSEEERRTALLQQVQINYAVSGSFEPGSTAKTLTLATAYESGAVSTEDTFYCDGAVPVANYIIHCHMDSLCGTLHPIEAFGRSCNVCFVEIGETIGAQKFAKFQELFNLGQKTNIDLPGEANTENLIYYEQGLGDIELATNSFGQGYNVTMVQMAAAYASILNGGYYYQPHVVKRIEDGAGNLVQEISPMLVRRTVSEETSELMKEALHYVVTKGTAGGILYMENYDFGGKTGAAEKLPRGTGKYVVSFIGAAPLANPRFLVYTVVDEPYTEDQSSSVPAQVLARAIFDRLMPYYGVYQETGDDAYSYDWSGLGDYSGDSDSQQGEEAVEDPGRTINWLSDDTDERN